MMIDGQIISPTNSSNKLSPSMHSMNSLKRFFQDNASTSIAKISQIDIINKHALQYNQRKLFPKSIIVEKEQLYEEVIIQKQNVNKLRQENLSLRTSNSGYEFQFNRLHNQSSLQIDQPEQWNHTAQILTYQKEIKKQNEEIKYKDSQILAIKKSIQYHRQQLLQKEVNRLNNEIYELQSMLEQNFQINENLKGTQTGAALQVLTADNMELAAVLGFEKFYVSQAVCKDQQTKIHQLEVKCRGMKRVLQEQQKDLDHLRQRDPIGDVNLKSNTLNEIRLKTELEKQSQQIHKLQSDFNQSQKKNHELERRIREVQTDMTSKNTLFEKEMLLIKQKNDKYDRENQQLIEKVKQLEKSGLNIKTRKSTIYVQGLDEQTFSSQRILINIPEIESKNSLAPSSDSDDIRVNGVHKQQVEQLALQLKYKLRKQKIQLSELDKYLFDDDNIKSGMISIFQLEQTLKKHPFSIMDNHNRILFVRYLIENNPKNSFIFDQDLTASLSQVRSIFKTLLSNYELYQDKDIILLMDHINKVLKQNKFILVDNLSKKQSFQEQYKVEDLFNIMEKQELPLTPQHLDFINQVLYDRTQNTELFTIKDLFKYFEENNSYSLNFA